VTASPFVDYESEVAELTNKVEREAILSCRRAIKEWADTNQETDLSDWKATEHGGDKIVGYLPVGEHDMARTRLHVPVPDSSLEDCVTYVHLHLQKCKELGDSVESVEVKKAYSCNTRQVHIKMKVIFPLGGRDILVNEQSVVHDNRAWIVHTSTTDASVPETRSSTRVDMPLSITCVRPCPEINGHEIIIE